MSDIPVRRGQIWYADLPDGESRQFRSSLTTLSFRRLISESRRLLRHMR